jgi:hypothetical protein
MVPVTIDVSGLVTYNPAGTSTSISLVTIAEYDKKGRDIYKPNKWEPDFEITGDLSLNLRSELMNKSSQGRIYTITITAEDCTGTYTFTTDVNVPQ